MHTAVVIGASSWPKVLNLGPLALPVVWLHGKAMVVAAVASRRGMPAVAAHRRIYHLDYEGAANPRVGIQGAVVICRVKADPFRRL